MAKMKIHGIDEYAEKISKLNRNREKILKRSIYVGAGEIADAVKRGLEGLPVQNGANGLPPYAKKNKLKGISSRQKKDLINSMGLSPMQELKLGYINTKLGFDGYGSVPTRSHPKGIPNSLLMRSIESGTTFREKNPVVRKSVNGARKRAIKKMGESIDKDLEKEI